MTLPQPETGSTPAATSRLAWTAPRVRRLVATSAENGVSGPTLDFNENLS
jgi:hypothetical protein